MSNKPEATTPPKPSTLPDAVVSTLSPKVPKYELSDKDLEGLELFQAASNYLATAMIFLTYAPIDKGVESLQQKDIKSRLLGVSSLFAPSGCPYCIETVN